MTPEQQSALALDHHVVVHANAGAGKTRVLVERFIAIVLSGKVERIEQIVATTFTIKAAAEMRSRIRARLLEISTDGLDPRTGSRLDVQTILRLIEFANNIGAARITTLHSFCASLLRKYAYESGVDVDAQELSQRRAHQWRSDAMRTTIRAWLQSGEQFSERRERLLTLLDELDVHTTEQTILGLMNGTERREHLAKLFSRGDEAIMDAWFAAIHTTARHLALRLSQHAQSELIRLQSEIGAKVADLIAGIDSAIELLHTADGPNVLLAVRHAYLRLDALYTKGGTPRRQKGKMPFEECPLLLSLQKSAWEALQEFAKDTLDSGVEFQLALVRTTFDVATEATATYQAMKTERNAIDFDDMMELTRTMLQRTDIRVTADVHRGIRFLMVDEFQDTSPVQYDIVRSLVGDAVNLFIVGDAKQSIYGFRGADVRLFLQATDDIVQANRSKGAPDGRVVLSASYRMSPNLLPVVNGICEPVFTHSSSGIEYTPLTGGRQGAAALLTGICTIVRTDIGAVYDDDEENTNALDVEMRHVVQRIVRVLDNPGVMVACKDDPNSVRSAGPGDVAILVRSSAGVMAAGAALRDAGVPFQTHSGRAFFSRPEVADIRNLLLWCTDTDDDLLFCALVRSPLVLLSDADMVRIAATPADRSLWNRMNVLADGGGASNGSFASEDVLRARASLQQWTTAVHVLAPTDFINRVLQESNWHSTLSNDPRRSQILLNVEKVIELILAEQDTSNASLRDIIMTLTPPASDLEGDRRFAADPNAVQVMTLHAAKGLEFPIVVLANIANRAPSSSTAWSDDIGLTFTPPKKIFTFDTPSGEAAPSDLLHKSNRMLGEGAAADEDRRLLYVGLTRAKDHLMISMPYANKKSIIDKKSASERESDGDEASGGKEPQQRATFGLAALMQDALATLIEDAPPGLHCSVVEFDGIAAQYKSTSEESPLVDASAALAVTSWLDIVTATDLLSHGLDSDQSGDSEAHDGVRADHGPAYGTLMHDILQHVVHAGPLNIEERASIVDNILATRLAALDAHVLARAEISNVMDSTFVGLHIHHLQKASVETTLLASLDSIVLQGMMDVRFESDASTMEVWDWKTNVVKHEADITSLALAYQPQAQAYAWLCLQAYPDVQTVRTRLLFTKAARTFPEAWVSMHEWTREMSAEIERSIIAAVHALIQRRRRRSVLN